MAEKSSPPYYPHPSESEQGDRLYPESIREENEDEYDDDDDEHLFNDNSTYRAIHSPMITYTYNNGHQQLIPCSAINKDPANFYSFINSTPADDEDELEQTPSMVINLPPPTTIHIQRVSSEDEIHFCSKRKRAKFVGPYLFGDVIGHGSYAKVKECLDQRNLCRRAVKIMQRRRLRRTPHGEKMAATEIRILKILNHPNTIRLYDFMRNDEKQKLYLFIDLCVISLHEMIDKSQPQNGFKFLPIWQAHGYFVQLIQGLEYLHSKFIIHNDIKPGNLLITIDHQLKITDFGTAEQLDLFSVDDTIKRSKGTPAFQCPEIANGEDSYRGFSVDIWSCGVTLYSIVIGKLPFDDENIYSLFKNIGAGFYQIPDQIEPNLKSLIRGLLNVDKDLRFTIEQIKQHDWFRRRPPRTFDFVPFPPDALKRFEDCTMYDYLTALHEPENEHEADEESTGMNMIDGSIPTMENSTSNRQDQPLINDSRNNSTNQQRNRRNRSGWNCACGRSMSDDQIDQRQRSNRHCTLS